MVKTNDITEDYFISNGYWKLSAENTIVTTDKWSMLIKACNKMVTKEIHNDDNDRDELCIGIITPEVMAKAINDGLPDAITYSYYVKKNKEKIIA